MLAEDQPHIRQVECRFVSWIRTRRAVRKAYCLAGKDRRWTWPGVLERLNPIKQLAGVPTINKLRAMHLSVWCARGGCGRLGA